jgi:hypothetical protein
MRSSSLSYSSSSARAARRAAQRLRLRVGKAAASVCQEPREVRSTAIRDVAQLHGSDELLEPSDDHSAGVQRQQRAAAAGAQRARMDWDELLAAHDEVDSSWLAATRPTPRRTTLLFYTTTSTSLTRLSRPEHTSRSSQSVWRSFTTPLTSTVSVKMRPRHACVRRERGRKGTRVDRRLFHGHVRAISWSLCSRGVPD